MPTDYKGDKQKPSKMALIISVGPKMPKSPEDTSKPDETSKPDDKAMKKAWDALKKQQDEPRRQPLDMDEYFRNLRNIANQAPIEPMGEPDDFMNYPPEFLGELMDTSPYKPTEQSPPSPYDMRNPPAEPRTTAPLEPYQPSGDEETRRKIMEMLPPIPPREERRANMMRDGTPHSPGQQSMIDRATEMYRQQKMRGE
tara:strand:- start:1077 stop:1670 length:594 start_codon:yes stop_codon:yes gene_type:complete